MEKSVTRIPAKARFQTSDGTSVSLAKKRTAAYARVSTDSDEQFTSYEAQVDYYTKYIRQRSDCEFVGVYTDEGITGTSTAHREGFKKMIGDAMSGRIDLIITKSVSRFARNTVDSLVTIRALKEKGVEVFFEKENIYTLDSKGELMLTIMSSLAQEESRSISENVKWGIHKRFQDGKVVMPYKNFLGYDRGPDGNPVINEVQAEIVRRIYSSFIHGSSISAIARELTASDVPSPKGKAQWSPSTIRSILSNEKYKGDAILQKTYTSDFLTKKSKVNNGEVTKYYVQNNHPAIISEDTFNLAQRFLDPAFRHHASSVFSNRVVCGCCGGIYGPKLWHSTDKYRRTIWQCNEKFKSARKCTSPTVTEEDLKNAYLKAVNSLVASIGVLDQQAYDIILGALDTAGMEGELAILEDKMQALATAIKDGFSQASFEPSSDAMRFQELKEKHGKLKLRIEDTLKRRSELKRFLDELGSIREPITVFDPVQFEILVDHMAVSSKETIEVVFKNDKHVE